MVKQIQNMNDVEIFDFINSHLTIKKEEKDKYGEVFTPPTLIENMLELFPKNVWSNPKLKWLDPTAGVGNFMVLVYLTLMKGLENIIKTKKSRSNHIIKNMLYMVEINKKNCKIMQEVFGSDCNIFCGDFLSDDLQFGCYDKCFDCIMGNPPFQDDYAHNSGKRILGGKNKLYERIFLKSYALLKDGGYLTFITPDNIFSGNSSTAYQTIVRNHIPYINFNANLKYFFPTIQQSVCYFFLEKISSSETLIENRDGQQFTLQLLDRPVNPVKNWHICTEKLIHQFISNEKNSAVYNRGKPVKEYKGRKYKIIYTPNEVLYTNNKELAVGYGIKKLVVFSISPELDFKMDYDGNYGVGPNTFFIPFKTKKQGQLLETFFRSDDYKLLANATKTTRLFLKNAFIQHLNLDKIMGNKKTKTFKRKYTNTGKTRKQKHTT